MRGCIIINLMVGLGVCSGFIRDGNVLGARLDRPLSLFIHIPADVALLNSMQRAYGRLGFTLVA